ncbi:MAG: hypothetical protein JSV16_05725 [Candidatus Hydrogenedentota bacterium]|nr:MAG: hypothetical protein JSV16_05725 [Candidatus Hydrogenedentota bacterium]
MNPKKYMIHANVTNESIVSFETSGGPLVIAFTDAERAKAYQLLVTKETRDRIACWEFEAESREDLRRKIKLDPDEATLVLDTDPGIMEMVKEWARRNA